MDPMGRLLSFVFRWARNNMQQENIPPAIYGSFIFLTTSLIFRGLYIVYRLLVTGKGEPGPGLPSPRPPRGVGHPGLYLDSEMSYATLMDLCKGGPLTVLSILVGKK